MMNASKSNRRTTSTLRRSHSLGLPPALSLGKLGRLALVGVCWISLTLGPSLVAKGFEAEVAGQPYTYKTTAKGPLHAYVVKPDDWKPTDQRPAIVFFHGGGWVEGAVSQFNEQSRYFAQRGLVCVQVQYRLIPSHSTIPPVVCIQDARSAMRWVRSHHQELGIDPHRIAAAGGSAGGHLAAQVGLSEGTDDPGDDLSISPKANALILFNPVLDNGPGCYGANRIGDRYRELSPAYSVTPDDPPAIVFIGTKDKYIAIATMEKFRDRMTKAGVRCDLHIYPGQEHGFFNSRNQHGKYYRLTLLAADQFLVSLDWLPKTPTKPSLQP